MLALVRHLDARLTDHQCQDIIDHAYAWDPETGAKPTYVRQCALREVCESRMRTVRPKDARSVWAALQRDEQHYASLSGRLWHPMPTNSEWLVTECGGGGDCLFHAIGFAIKSSMSEVRAMAAQGVTVENVDLLLDYYNRVYPVSTAITAPIAQLPTVAERAGRLREVINTPGCAYMGDDTTLRLIVSQCKHRVGFVVFDTHGNIHGQVFMSRYVRQLIALYHTGDHWQLVGCKVRNDPLHRVQTTFDPFAPPEFLTQKLGEIGVNMAQHYATWAPRLELERSQ